MMHFGPSSCILLLLYIIYCFDAPEMCGFLSNIPTPICHDMRSTCFYKNYPVSALHFFTEEQNILQVCRLIYTNSGLAILALASNAVHNLWKWQKSDQNVTGKVLALVLKSGLFSTKSDIKN